MIISKTLLLSHSRHLGGCNLLQLILKNDILRTGSSRGRLFLTSTRFAQSTSTLNQPNDLSTTSTSSSMMTTEFWPNLLFTDDTWSEVDEDERFAKLTRTAWDSVGSQTHIRNFSTFQLLFTHPHRENVIKIISEELDLSYQQADVYLNFLRIKPLAIRIDEIRFIRERRNLLRLLKAHLSKKDIIDAFELFSLPLRVTHYRISFFKECGFRFIKPFHLLNFGEIYASSDKTLKHLKLLDSDINVVDSLLSNLQNLSQDETSQLRDNLTSKGLSLGKQYAAAISFMLKRTRNTVKICESKHHSRYLTIRGLNILSKLTIDFKLNESYSSSEMRSLCEADPVNLEQIIARIPKQFDETTLLVLLKYPKVLHTYYSTLLDNLSLFKNTYGFTNDDIDNLVYCLMFETKDLKSRIENLISLFGKPSRLMLSLVHLDISELSNLLHEMKENGFSTSDVSSVHKYHSMTIKKPKFYPGMIPAHLRGLNRELGVPQSIIIRTLYRHPHFRFTDNHKIRKTYNFIKNLEGITEEQIYNGLTACLYDIERIEEALDKMKNREDFEEWKRHPYFLESLVYMIEKADSFESILTSDCQESTATDYII